MRLLFIVLMLIVPSISLAAYQNPVIAEKSKTSSVNTVIWFEFGGNSNEPTERRGYTINRTSTLDDIQYWADETIKELDAIRAIETLPQLQLRSTLTRKVRPVVVAPVE